jgi:hypothetical protein
MWCRADGRDDAAFAKTRARKKQSVLAATKHRAGNIRRDLLTLGIRQIRRAAGGIMTKFVSIAAIAAALALAACGEKKADDAAAPAAEAVPTDTATAPAADAMATDAMAAPAADAMAAPAADAAMAEDESRKNTDSK